MGQGCCCWLQLLTQADLGVHCAACAASGAGRGAGAPECCCYSGCLLVRCYSCRSCYWWLVHCVKQQEQLVCARSCWHNMRGWLLAAHQPGTAVGQHWLLLLYAASDGCCDLGLHSFPVVLLPLPLEVTGC